MTSSTTADSSTQRLSWKQLNEEIKGCTRCPGLNIRGITENAVGYGDRQARVMFAGQSLCTQCMAQQEPFYKESGLLLEDIFEKVGKKKNDFFTTNVVHCHPMHNRTSTQDEISACSPFLKREILLVRPDLIVPLGRDAIERFVGRFDSIKTVLYQKHYVKLGGKSFLVRPAYHPAYFWRKGRYSKETKQYVSGMAKLITPYL